MKKVVLNYLVIAAIAVLVAFQFGCSKKSETSDETIYVYQFGYSVPVAIVPKEKLPEFLRERIDYCEREYSKSPMTGVTVEFFRGEWKKRTVYYYYHSFSSCMFCEVYDSDGTKLDWSDEDHFAGFYSKFKNWVLIYKIGNRFGE